MCWYYETVCIMGHTHTLPVISMRDLSVVLDTRFAMEFSFISPTNIIIIAALYYTTVVVVTNEI